MKKEKSQGTEAVPQQPRKKETRSPMTIRAEVKRNDRASSQTDFMQELRLEWETTL